MVVWDRGDYIVEANRQLSDRQVYEEVDRDPTVDLSNIIESRLQDLSVEDPGIEEVVEYLSSGGGNVGRFYLLTKIHKGLDRVKGRPVISDCGTFTEHISEYLDHHLNQLVCQRKSYIKDTNIF